MSSLTRTIGRAKRRLHWPESKWRQIRLFAYAWRFAKAEKIEARKNGRKLIINDWTAYCNHLVQKWTKAAREGKKVKV